MPPPRRLARGGQIVQGEVGPTRNPLRVPLIRLSNGWPIARREHPALARTGGDQMVSAMDEIETFVAPSAIERAMEIFEEFKDRDHCKLV
jgi:hypothetical protein